MEEEKNKNREEPEIDESLLTPKQLEEYHRKPKTLFWGLLFLGFLIIIVALVIVILSLPPAS